MTDEQLLDAAGEIIAAAIAVPPDDVMYRMQVPGVGIDDLRKVAALVAFMAAWGIRGHCQMYMEANGIDEPLDEYVVRFWAATRKARTFLVFTPPDWPA